MTIAIQVDDLIDAKTPTGVTALVTAEWVNSYFISVSAAKIIEDGFVFVPSTIWSEMGLPTITNLGVTEKELEYKETRFESAKG